MSNAVTSSSNIIAPDFIARNIVGHYEERTAKSAYRLLPQHDCPESELGTEKLAEALFLAISVIAGRNELHDSARANDVSIALSINNMAARAAGTWCRRQQSVVLHAFAEAA